ncbi:hypothetical protein [Aquimarina algiphila]|uniref:hypothetical protein n=1 Tax=Aquimarina algiphila TaxID=2047982 RepID=UPI0024931166|nr:hypothetical protein [Aquimarina algiphila]
MIRFNRFFIVIISLFILNCSPKKDYQINLKWNKSYSDDTLNKNLIGLQWCLSYLGSTIANDSISPGLTYNDSIISLNIKELGFNNQASNFLASLSYKLKQSEEYKHNNSIDLGRFMAYTIGSPYHYYRIVDVPQKLSDYYELYQFDSIKGYINNSSVSHVDRIIQYSNSSKELDQAFISFEIDSVTKKILEYETMEIMSNGQIKFGIYDINGRLKKSADPKHTKAGKPAKCMWCHEVNIQPLFNDQENITGYLPYITFNDSLEKFDKKLKLVQDSLWKNKALKDKKQHTLMEISYISFMEPSLERLSKEWSLSIDIVLKKVKNFKTHRHHEFDFLGDLYNRNEIDKIAPWKTTEIPSSIREKSYKNP